jgi:hypothetical protein
MIVLHITHKDSQHNDKNKKTGPKGLLEHLTTPAHALLPSLGVCIKTYPFIRSLIQYPCMLTGLVSKYRRPEGQT